ncbi:hypothetical protein [Sulfobacillus thermosulfidooxidans]|nr:hypothetical protein [Sulfobacillus thermosulfidooxidans]
MMRFALNDHLGIAGQWISLTVAELGQRPGGTGKRTNMVHSVTACYFFGC